MVAYSAVGPTIFDQGALRRGAGMRYDSGIGDGSQQVLEVRWHRKFLADLI